MRPDAKHGKTWRKSGRPARYHEPKHRGRVRNLIAETEHAADDVPNPALIAENAYYDLLNQDLDKIWNSAAL